MGLVAGTDERLGGEGAELGALQIRDAGWEEREVGKGDRVEAFVRMEEWVGRILGWLGPVLIRSHKCVGGFLLLGWTRSSGLVFHLQTSISGFRLEITTVDWWDT